MDRMREVSKSMVQTRSNDIVNDQLVRSMCSQCWNGCGIVVHVREGTVTKIEGDPNNPHNKGVICAKGLSGPHGIYSPYRVKQPLMRTNSEKGLEIDPLWKPISWDEALAMVSGKLKEIRKGDPRRLMFASFDYAGGPMPEYAAWTEAFGSPNFTPGSADFFCGNSVHTLHYLNQAAYHGGVDFKYCKFLLQIGTQWGSVINSNVLGATQELAEARAFDQIRTVVVDPWCSFAGSKADEWVPIRPGTDAAFVLSLVNVIVNELGRVDDAFLKSKTNAPYLVGHDNLYVRDKLGKPLVWDLGHNEAKPFDDHSVQDYALTGEFTTAEGKCKPGYQLLKENVKKYTPEWVSEITSVPKETIRKLAKDWITEARIGETVEVDGQVLPYRPVAINWYRGSSAHKHSNHIGYAMMLLPTLVGAVDVPGGSMGEGRMPKEWTTAEGLLATESKSPIQPPYPPRTVTAPNSVMYFELFPIAPYSPVMVPLTQLNPEKYKVPYGLEMLIQVRNNIVKSSGPTDLMEKWIKTIPFVVSFSTTLDETAQMSDVVIPDMYYLEREAIWRPDGHPGIEGPNYHYMQHQAVKPPFDPPYDSITSLVDILAEIAARANFLDDFNNSLNSLYGMKETYKLLPDVQYTWGEICDRKMKNSYGEDHGLEWFKQNQVLTFPKSVKAAYPGAYRKSRIHLYYEFIEKSGKEVEKMTKELGIPWETADYKALPNWIPCPSFSPRSAEYDMWIISAKVPTHTLSGSIYYPTLLAATSRHLFDKGVLINTKTAGKKHIQYGDQISIETETGKRQKAIALVSEIVHPEVIVCFGNYGRKVRSIPNAKGIGVDFNYFLELDEAHIDFVDGALDSCIRVKVSKEEN